MSHQVLARKWRPRSFKEMVGQEHVLRMLTNALDNQRLHHAYLFTGTRGVGKTSVARLFAKCLNCETGITSTPCNQCQICQSIDGGRFLDLIEVDAASKTKVEDTRELLENVQYAPCQGRFKIYLIDEVHMLSGHSFNALLKTLEEPPAHVKFLLATTDPKQLPITILSRCLQFYLKRVPVDQITEHLEHISKAEKISYEKEALTPIAQAADGSLRDALSLLDQAIAYTNADLKLTSVREMLGYVEHQSIVNLLKALANRNGIQLLEIVQRLEDQAPDFNYILEELLSILHNIAVCQVIPEKSNIDTDTTAEKIREFVKLFSPEEVQLYYQIALIGRRDLPLLPNPAQGFEMILLRMLAFEPGAIKTSATTPHPQNKIETSKAPITPAHSDPKIKAVTDVPISNKPMSSKSPAPTTHNPINENDWLSMLPRLGLTGLAYALASNCSLISIDENKIELGLSPLHGPMFNKKLEERIEQALTQSLKRPIKLSIKITGKEIHTPAKEKLQQDHQLKNAAERTIQGDATVKQIMDIFGASLEPQSIKPIKKSESAGDFS